MCRRPDLDNIQPMSEQRSLTVCSAVRPSTRRLYERAYAWLVHHYRGSCDGPLVPSTAHGVPDGLPPPGLRGRRRAARHPRPRAAACPPHHRSLWCVPPALQSVLNHHLDPPLVGPSVRVFRSATVHQTKIIRSKATPTTRKPHNDVEDAWMACHMVIVNHHAPLGPGLGAAGRV